MMPLRRTHLLLVICITAVGVLPCHSFQPAAIPIATPGPRIGRTEATRSELFLAGENKESKPKGVYVRPSAVIEKGSGFFFPGLEGPRVRLVVGSGLLLVTAINHVFSSSTSAFSEGLAVFYSLLVLLQGAIETTKEGRIESIQSSPAKAAKANLAQKWRTNTSTGTGSDTYRNNVEWAAASFLSLTPATHMILLQDDEIQYWLGATTQQSQSGEDQVTAAVQAALNTIRQSKGGRVALPDSHPAATGIIPQEEHRKCVILQRINSSSCWMVASDDLLASFTKQDLQWLGQLASYVNLPVS